MAWFWFFFWASLNNRLCIFLLIIPLSHIVFVVPISIFWRNIIFWAKIKSSNVLRNSKTSFYQLHFKASFYVFIWNFQLFGTLKWKCMNIVPETMFVQNKPDHKARKIFYSTLCLCFGSFLKILSNFFSFFAAVKVIIHLLMLFYKCLRQASFRLFEHFVFSLSHMLLQQI